MPRSGNVGNALHAVQVGAVPDQRGANWTSPTRGPPSLLQKLRRLRTKCLRKLSKHRHGRAVHTRLQLTDVAPIDLRAKRKLLLTPALSVTEAPEIPPYNLPHLVHAGLIAASCASSTIEYTQQMQPQHHSALRPGKPSWRYRQLAVPYAPGTDAKAPRLARALASLAITLAMLACQHRSTAAQSLPDEETVKKQAAATPVDELLKIPREVCSMHVSIEYPLPDQNGPGYPPPAREITFCEYAANLAAGHTGHISEMKIWNVSAHVVPVVGFVTTMAANIYTSGHDVQLACTFKNSGGKLVYAGVWIKDLVTGETGYMPSFDKNRCLQLTRYYDGEKARGAIPPRQTRNFEPVPPKTQMTSEQVQKLIDRLRNCWEPPASIRDRPDLTITAQLNLDRDGSLAGEPTILNPSSNPLFMEASRSVIAAITKCQPFDFLPTAAYEQWRQVIVDFNPQEQ